MGKQKNNVQKPGPSLQVTLNITGRPRKQVTTLPTPLRHQDGSHLCESQTPGKGFKTSACHSFSDKLGHDNQ